MPNQEYKDAVKKLVDLIFDSADARLNTDLEENLFLPESLREAIKSYGDSYPDLKTFRWQKLLSGIEIDGKAPSRPGDWLRIYHAIDDSIEEG